MTEQESTDECIKCGTVAGYHCISCCCNILDIKNVKDVNLHETKCKNPIYLNPLIE